MSNGRSERRAKRPAIVTLAKGQYLDATLTVAPECQDAAPIITELPNMNDKSLSSQLGHVDHGLPGSYGRVDLRESTRQQDKVALKRYMLEQTFVGDKGGLEQYMTAVISIIGNEPLIDFEEQLAKFEYDGAPGICESNVSGRWLNGDTQILPTYYMGLILLSTFSPLALLELKAEMQRYREANVFAIVGLPIDANIAESMTSALAGFGDDAHFVQMVHGGEETPVCQKFADAASHYVESTLTAMTYPGLVNVDQADAITIFSSGKFTRIIRYEAATASDLLHVGYTKLESNDHEVGVIAALFAPSSLRLRDIHDVMNLVKARRTSDRSMVIFAASGSKHRRQYVLYVATCG